MEEEECRAEGIACPVLEFADNSQVMELLQQKPAGVLSLTNEEVNALQEMVREALREKLGVELR